MISLLDIVLMISVLILALSVLGWLLRCEKRDLEFAGLVVLFICPLQLVLAVCAAQGGYLVTAVVLAIFAMAEGFRMVLLLERRQPSSAPGLESGV